MGYANTRRIPSCYKCGPAPFLWKTNSPSQIQRYISHHPGFSHQEKGHSHPEKSLFSPKGLFCTQKGTFLHQKQVIHVQKEQNILSRSSLWLRQVPKKLFPTNPVVKYLFKTISARTQSSSQFRWLWTRVQAIFNQEQRPLYILKFLQMVKSH